MNTHAQAPQQACEHDTQRERAWHERERTLRLVLEDQTELIALTAPDGTLDFVNRAYARFYGTTPEALLGRSVYDHVACEDREFVRQQFAALAARADGQPIVVENRVRSTTGEMCWYEWRNRVRLNATGQVEGIHCVGRDISAQKAATAALRLSEARLRTVYEHTPGLLCSTDLGGRILTVSDAWLRTLGYLRHELIGRRAMRLLVPGTPKRAEALARDLLANGHSEGHTLRVRRQDGSTLSIRMSAILKKDEEQGQSRIITIAEDITEQLSVAAELRANQAHLAMTAQSTGIGIWEHDPQTDTFVANDEMRHILGRGRQQLKKTLQAELEHAHPEDQHRIEQAIARALKDQDSLDLDFRIVRPSGEVRHLNTRVIVFRNEQGRAVRILGSSLDVTERKRLEQDLAEKHELMQVTMSAIADAVITTDAKGLVQWLNPAAEQLCACSVESAIGLPLPEVFTLIDEHTRALLPSAVATCMHMKQAQKGLSGRLLSRSGHEYAIEQTVSPILNAHSEVLGAVLIFRDVTTQQAMAREIQHRAMHDAVTGLFNRGEFDRRLHAALERAKADDSSHAVLFIDLDQFKLVNDACGHAVGDQLLRQVAALFQTRIRASDTLARLGGDEFGVILDSCSLDHARDIAQHICNAMEQFRFVHDGRRFRVGASIGLVPLDGRWQNATQLLQAADSVCYAAKEAGRNRVQAWHETDASIQTRQGEAHWASRLEQAMDENLFTLYAQRIAPLKAQGQAQPGLHAELLIRLRGHDGQVIPPGAFLPAAERFHVACRIDRWVLTHALHLLETHEDSCPQLELLAINLSGQSIGDRSFHTFMTALLAQTRFDVTKLCLEITETAAITNLSCATDFITDMRRQGVKIALDDFGAGSSSFGYLKNLPVDYLKIDGQFIQSLTHSALDHAAVRCFHDVAQVLGIQTIAEFVENEAIMSELRRIGIDYAQGYLVHRPEPLESLLQTLRPPPAH